MTDIEITPEVIWAVRRAAVLDVNLPDSIVNELGDWAERLERKQADEKRIDELAQVFLEAAHSNASEWEKQPQSIQDKHRAGIRAVLAKLDENVVDADVYGVRDNGDVLLAASDAASVKAVLRFVFGRNNGEPYPAADIETLKFYFWPEMSNTIGGSK